MNGWIDRSAPPKAYQGKLTGRLASLESEYAALRARRNTSEPPTWEVQD